jgi:hypothetical protein
MLADIQAVCSEVDEDYFAFFIHWLSSDAHFVYMGHLFSPYFADKCQKCANCHDRFCLSGLDEDHSFISHRLLENLINWRFKHLTCMANAEDIEIIP